MAEWFPFSSTFYLELDDEEVSERAQMLLLRCIAYIANTENMDGYISKKALKKLGLSAIYRRVTELIDAQIMVETDDRSGYVFPAFQKWGQPLIAHVRKKNKDREYQSNKRKSARESYDDRTKIATQRREEKRNTTYVGSAAYVPDAGAHPSRSTTGPAVPTNGWALVRDVIPPEHAQATKTALAIEAADLLNAGTPAADVTAALRLWLTKPRAGPRMLPHLLSDVIKSRTTPNAGTVTEKVNGWLDIANQAEKLADQQKALEQ